MIEIGQKVRFDSIRDNKSFGCCKNLSDGVVTYINAPHRWFLVEYGNQPVIRTSFSFDCLSDGTVKYI